MTKQPQLKRVTPMAFVRDIVRAYEKYGKKPDHALRCAGITAAQLWQPDATIAATQMETISATAMKELDDEALGWFSRRLPWGTYGMLCRASFGAPNLRMAMKRWCRHHALLTDDILLTLDLDGSTACIVIHEQRDLGVFRELCLLTSLRYLHGYSCWLVDSCLPVMSVRFPFPPPRHASSYPHLFPGPVTFDADKTSIICDARYLEFAPRRDDAALSRMLENALRLTVRQYRPHRLLVERVRSLLSDPAHCAATADDIARSMRLSVRSLHRHLASEGARLQALKIEVRCTRAMDLLQRTDMPIKQLASRAGFENEKSFARAFRTWVGMSPSEWRASRSR